MKTIILGDIHGCFRSMEKILELAEFDPGKDTLISVGDLVDRGPRVYEVIEYMIELKAKMGARCVIVLGNHEDMAMENGFFPGDLWIYNGAGKTLDSFLAHGEDIHSDRFIHFFDSMPYFYKDPENRFIVTHAGLTKNLLEDNSPQDMLWNRDFEQYEGKLCICGHTPVSNPFWKSGIGAPVRLLPDTAYELPENGLIDIDTGCVFGYNLSAMIISGNAFRILSVANCE